MISVPGCIYDLDNESDLAVSNAEIFILLAATWVPAKRIKWDDERQVMICSVEHGCDKEICELDSDHWVWDDEFVLDFRELYDAAVSAEKGGLL